MIWEWVEESCHLKGSVSVLLDEEVLVASL